MVKYDLRDMAFDYYQAKVNSSQFNTPCLIIAGKVC